MTANEINQIISENLKTVRLNTYRLVKVKKGFKRKCLTQTEVGNSINVTFQQIQKYENGTNKIGSAHLKIVSDYFGIPIQDMFVPIKTYNKEIGDVQSVDNVVLDN